MDVTENSRLIEKTVGATKWSLVTQLASKLISPFTTVALARILAPEAIGVVSLVNMVTSFADLFSDAGFQKYLIQHEYGSDDQLGLSADVAFWTNLAVSLLLWGGIAFFRDEVATLVGGPTIGIAIAVACASLPLTAATSVQTAVYQRAFDFRTLFYSRVGSSLLIFFVSVPMALLGAGYWSMITGTIASNLFLAIWLTVRSEWRPSLRYSISELRAMFSFSAWTLVESFSVWLTNWAGTFVLGRVMTGYYIGLYNTSTSLVNAIIGIVTSAVNPVVFSSLSRLQDDRPAFNRAFYSMQKALAICVVPIATALFVFSGLAIDVALGSQWGETATFFGLYSLASALVVVFGHIASDAYRALGHPRLSLLAQIGFLAIMVPSLYVGALMGYGTFSVVVPVVRVAGCFITHFLICRLCIGLSPARMLGSLRWVYVATALVAIPMWVVVRVTEAGDVVQVALLVLSLALYLLELLLFRDLRTTASSLLKRFGLTSIVKNVLPRWISRPHSRGCGDYGGRDWSDD